MRDVWKEDQSLWTVLSVIHSPGPTTPTLRSCESSPTTRATSNPAVTRLSVVHWDHSYTRSWTLYVHTLLDLPHNYSPTVTGGLDLGWGGVSPSGAKGPGVVARVRIGSSSCRLFSSRVRPIHYHCTLGCWYPSPPPPSHPNLWERIIMICVHTDLGGATELVSPSSNPYQHPFPSVSWIVDRQ